MLMTYCCTDQSHARETSLHYKRMSTNWTPGLKQTTCSLTFLSASTWLSLRKEQASHLHLFTLQGHHLEHVECFRIQYLGLLLTSDLPWSTHVDSICSKASIWSTAHSEGKFLDMCSYFSASRVSILGWHILSGDVPGMHTIGVGSAALHIGSIFCTVVPAVFWDQAYSQLLHLLDITEMFERRLYPDLCTMFKIVHGLFNFPSGISMAELEVLTDVPLHITHYLHYFMYPLLFGINFHRKKNLISSKKKWTCPISSKIQKYFLKFLVTLTVLLSPKGTKG